MDVRRRSIRFRVFVLVVIPVLSLIGVYAFAVGTSAGDAVRLARATSVTASIWVPNTRVQSQLDAESLIALAYLSAPTNSSLAALRRQEDTRSVSRLSAVTFYNNLAIAGFRVYDGSIEEATSVPLVTQGLDLAKLGEVEQLALEETEESPRNRSAGRRARLSAGPGSQPPPGTGHR